MIVCLNQDETAWKQVMTLINGHQIDVPVESPVHEMLATTSYVKKLVSQVSVSGLPPEIDGGSF